MKLNDLGWDPFFEKQFEQFKAKGKESLRILRVNKDKFLAQGVEGKFSCQVSGKFRFAVRNKSEFPTVGDWVVASVSAGEKKATIHAVLRRKSSFSRKVAGQTTDEQVVAANIDTVFIVTGLDLNFNLRRIERFFSMALESGAEPVFLLNKSDICDEAEKRKAEVEGIAMGFGVHLVSALKNEGLEALQKYMEAGKTVAFLGSSGVGKSTIINSLLGSELLETKEVSDLGSRGAHTTSFRELIVLPNGGMVIDTPGMREIQVWGDEEGMKQAFDDVEELTKNCRFRDCGHESEPGCAVQAAIDDGSLELERLQSYLKLKKEFAYLSERQTKKPSAIEKDRWKKVSQKIKKIKKNPNAKLER